MHAAHCATIAPPRRDVASLDHVPLLPKTLERVLLPAHLQRHLEAFRKDRSHGAAELALAVVGAFQEGTCRDERTIERMDWEVGGQGRGLGCTVLRLGSGCGGCTSGGHGPRKAGVLRMRMLAAASA
jgi:hypothetical protein